MDFPDSHFATACWVTFSSRARAAWVRSFSVRSCLRRVCSMRDSSSQPVRRLSMIAYIIQPQVVFVKRFPKNDRYNRCGRAVRQPHVYKYILQARIFRLSMVKDTSRREDAARQGACEIRAHYGGPVGRARQTGACRRAGRVGADAALCKKNGPCLKQQGPLRSRRRVSLRTAAVPAG